MEGLVDFVDDLLWGAEIVALASVVGAVVWAWVVLRLRDARAEGWRSAGALCARVLALGAASLAAVQAIDLTVNAWIVKAINGWPGVFAFVGTIQFKAGVERVAVATALAVAVAWLAHEPTGRRRWALVTALTVLLISGGAWLTHAQSRLDHRTQLMVLTALHQTAASAWAGGVAQLLVLWRGRRRRPELDRLWPVALRRFAAVGIIAVLVLIGTGSLLTRAYVGTWRGLFGTGYGTIVVTKIVLLGAALTLAATNFRAARQSAASRGLLFSRVPVLVEGEGMLLVALLLAAASLAAQPTAVDARGAIPTWAEMGQELAPKLPRVISPRHAAVMAVRSGPLDAPSEEFTPADAWSEFNHNVSGLFLVGMALAAIVDRITRLPFTGHWPLGFGALGVFLFIRSDPETWPLGPVPFLTSLTSADVLQHRLATLLVLVLGLIEWRVRRAEPGSTRFQYVFPMLSLAGGILLLTHTHSEATLKSTFLIQLSHTAMGMLAILVACGRWLELRLRPPGGRLAGLGATLGLLLIGIVLIFYREPTA